jgi:hypothetical protein
MPLFPTATCLTCVKSVAAMSQDMPSRRDIQFVRDGARRIRDIAQHRTPLQVMGAEPEARAGELQRQQD